MNAITPSAVLAELLIAVPAKADQATSKDRGALFTITENGLWGYINRKGDVVVEPQFQMAGPFFEGMAEIIENFKVGFIDVTGRVVIKPQFEPAMFRSFREGLAHVQVAGKWGYIDKTGTFVIKPQFDDAYSFFEGLANAKVSRK